MNSSGYGPPTASSHGPGGVPQQRQPAHQAYEAPACVQNAMMNKERKPFTYTPGGIDLSQIKSERMAKRLARNAQSEGAAGASQINRPMQAPSSPGASSAVAGIGPAALGVPFQVLPSPSPTPPATPATPPTSTIGKQQKSNGNIGVAPHPPPPPPPTSSNITTLSPPNINKTNAMMPSGSPNAARKSPTPQRFEPPPLGFRPEIKIPPNPMASLKKITPPVEKNNFWVEEYRKERSKSPMVGSSDNNTDYNSNGGQEISNNNNNKGINDAFKNSPLAMSTKQPGVEIRNNYNNDNHNYQQTASQQQSSPLLAQHSEKKLPEFRSVTPPQSPKGLAYTKYPQQPEQQSQHQQQNNIGNGQNSLTQQQNQQQQILPIQPPTSFSPQLQQQRNQSPKTNYVSSTPSPHNTPPNDGQSSSPAQSVPWRVQRGPQQQEQMQSKQLQQHPQPIFNNVKNREVYTPEIPATATSATANQNTQQHQQIYQGPKPTNVGTLYIAPLESNETNTRNIQRQPTTARWMCSQPVQNEQPTWARPEQNGNVIPSNLQGEKLPPATLTQPQQQQPLQQQQQQQYRSPQGTPQNFGAHHPSPAMGLRLQISSGINNNSNNPKERIIPIQLEETPPHSPAHQPSFGTQTAQSGTGNIVPSSYVTRSPNQFVDQGYSNYSASPQQIQLQKQQQQQQLQQQQQRTPNGQYNNNNNSTSNVGGGPKTHIIPIKIEDQNEGTRGPISRTPIVLQNDQRTPPIQSKSFRILQKITDTVGDQNGVTASGTGQVSVPTESIDGIEPQLHKPQFSRQMSAQQARKSPNIEQMKRMQIAQDQQHHPWNSDTSRPYIHPSEQQVPEPKKYTGSAIPSRSFKILQAMTTPENAGPGQSDL